MCAEMKEQAQAHYFGTILAIPVPFRKNRIQNTESLKECDFPILINQNIPTAFRHFVIVDTLLKDRNSFHTEKTLTVYCLLFRISPPKRALSLNIINH